MELSLPSVALSANIARHSSSAHWTVGQLLELRVDGIERDGLTRIRVGTDSYRAATTLPLPPGTRLRVQVTQITPAIHLTPLGDPQAERINVVRSALAQALPRQSSLPQLLTTLDHQLAELPRLGTANNAITNVLEQSAAKIRNLPTTVAELREPSTLKATIENSGVAMERNLSALPEHARSVPNGSDLKWQLLQLKTSLERAQRSTTNSFAKNPSNLAMAPVETARNVAAPAADRLQPGSTHVPRDEFRALNTVLAQIDGALARIEVNQLKTVQSLFEGHHVIRLDLPISTHAGYRSVEFEIERQNANELSGEPGAFVIRLRLPLSGGDEMSARIHWRDGATSIRLWSDSDSVRNDISQFREHLFETLERRGLKNPTIAIAPGAPSSTSLSGGSGLIDTTA